MKKFLMALGAAAFLALAPAAASAECYPIASAKADVAKWDTDAQWEYLKSGPVFDKLLAYATAQRRAIAGVDGIVVMRSSKGVVIFAQSANGQCVEMSSAIKMSKAQFEALVGGEV